MKKKKEDLALLNKADAQDTIKKNAQTAAGLCADEIIAGEWPTVYSAFEAHVRDALSESPETKLENIKFRVNIVLELSPLPDNGVKITPCLTFSKRHKAEYDAAEITLQDELPGVSASAESVEE